MHGHTDQGLVAVGLNQAMAATRVASGCPSPHVSEFPPSRARRLKHLKSRRQQPMAVPTVPGTNHATADRPIPLGLLVCLCLWLPSRTQRMTIDLMVGCGGEVVPSLGGFVSTLTLPRSFDGWTKQDVILASMHRTRTAPHPLPLPLGTTQANPSASTSSTIMSAVVAAVPGTEEIALEIKKPAPKVSEISSRKGQRRGYCAVPSCAVACHVLTRRLPPLYLPNRSLLRPSWSLEPWRAWWVPFASSLLVRAGIG